MTGITFVQHAARVRTPATSANLGPGFDAIGVALSISDEIIAEIIPAGLQVEVEGEGAAELPRDERHLVLQAMRAVFDRVGANPPGLLVRCRNNIPQARGLGSSAAAIVGGAVVARALIVGGDQLLDDDEMLQLTVDLDGSRDNVAACLLGGAVLAWSEADCQDRPGTKTRDRRHIRTARLRLSPEIAPTVYVPQARSSTKASLALLPKMVSHADAVANSGRAALLVHALTTDPSLLIPATEDWLHQEYRAPGMATTAACVRRLREQGIAAVVSGAGSSVFAMLRAGQQPPMCDGFVAHRLSFDPVGALSSVSATVDTSRA